MKILNRIFIFLVCLVSSFLICSSVEANAPGFVSLTAKDVDNITKEFGANFTHASVMGAASLGKVFGLEFGIVASQTSSPETDTLVKKSSSDDSLPNLYNAGVLLGVSVPFGVTGELVMMPKISSQDVNFQSTSMALKLTLNDELLTVIPFNLAVRVFSSNAVLDFKQEQSGVSGTVENKTTVTGIQLLASPSLPMIEPYAGVGFLTAKNNIGLSGTGTIFNTSVTTGQSLEGSATSTQILMGVDAKLWLFSMGLEYSRAFETNRYSAKLGFVF